MSAVASRYAHAPPIDDADRPKRATRHLFYAKTFDAAAYTTAAACYFPAVLRRYFSHDYFFDYATGPLDDKDMLARLIICHASPRLLP